MRTRKPITEDEQFSTQSLGGWQKGSDGSFLPSGHRELLSYIEAGAYNIRHSNSSGFYLEPHAIVTDELYQLPDDATKQALESITAFWDNEKVYRQHKLLYKRGIILYGPQGSGKSSIINMISKEIISNNGVIIYANANIVSLRAILGSFRDIEPTRRIVVIMEDLENIIEYGEESALLSILDGENQIDNIVFIATTNYPRKLPARIVNRPSRFDDIILVPLPSAEAREFYIKSVAKGVIGDELSKWVADTEGMSIAHVRELIIGVDCLNKDYDTVIGRLQAMAKRPDAVAGFADGGAEESDDE